MHKLHVIKYASRVFEELGAIDFSNDQDRKEADGELSHHMNTRVPSEPGYDLRKRNHSQQQQNGMLLLFCK